MAKIKSDYLTIQPGCLFYDLDAAPIGGKAGRAPDDGLIVSGAEEITLWHGCNRVGYTPKGKKIAFNIEFTKERYSHAKY